ncbi:hypothetical protein LTR10_021836 [Elasticomyces elasticus]|uniref:NADPH--cytochrome P450 reductase n=1 Tax=Exophiala sideris TaxID=1016849 RepID=A0ABR0JF34_9EURO|nr:hypothetical protein LTR10_021836 [Elasticomyces elasticus]KAK5025268.1 hypothetical protein LTS07_008119 [Exophiala sideris]KAK5029183.1 hypothetical protein LTR13_008720 [Exophiala sideris]KAK5063328.1 hypothetical protein LTR69_004034 [Exophiala sideris]KAK5179043.1 hypothetical protein LTR44_008532 [Eurotiomycetes sp. CCFEE 6388]
MNHKFLDVSSLPQVGAHLLQLIRPTSAADLIAWVATLITTLTYLSWGVLWDKADPYYHIYFERPQQQAGVNTSGRQAQRNIAEKLSETRKTAVVLWGSQSGTAERLANQLVKECQSRFGLATLAADLSDYDAESIADLSKANIVILILSTYGEGDPSDNASAFWDWITNTQTHLGNLRYVAFGLGNSNYKYYNRVVDVVVQMLDKVGAQRLLSVGKADEAAHSTEEDFLAWKDDLFHLFRSELGLIEQAAEYEPALSVVEDDSLSPIDLHQGEPSSSIHNSKAAAACSPVQPLPIKLCRELFNSPDRHCVHMELDLSEYPAVNYKTGDHIAIWPANPQTEVDILLTVLNLRIKQDIPISLKPTDPAIKLNLPTPTTIRALFHRYLEICAPVSRTTVQGLANFAPSTEAKAYLLKLGQDKVYYSSYLSHTHLTLGRLLNLASPNEAWSSLPLSFVVEVLPQMQPRYYSISSSSVLSPRRATITALVAAEFLPSVPNMPNIERQLNRGVTSNYLLALSQAKGPVGDGVKSECQYDLASPADLLHGTRLYAHVRKSRFKLPIQSSCPIIMVAAGTGLAPFRAFIAERAKLHAVGKPIGEMMLFFGCRKQEEDFIYREELEQVQDTVGRDIFKIVTAFSRSGDGEREKVYVQQRVWEHGQEVVSLIEDKGASFYICGRASMAREVGVALGEAVRDLKAWEDVKAMSWSEGLKRHGKWREDVWG